MCEREFFAIYKTLDFRMPPYISLMAMSLLSCCLHHFIGVCQWLMCFNMQSSNCSLRVLIHNKSVKTHLTLFEKRVRAVHFDWRRCDVLWLFLPPHQRIASIVNVKGLSSIGDLICITCEDIESEQDDIKMHTLLL